MQSERERVAFVRNLYSNSEKVAILRCYGGLPQPISQWFYVEIFSDLFHILFDCTLLDILSCDDTEFDAFGRR